MEENDTNYENLPVHLLKIRSLCPKEPLQLFIRLFNCFEQVSVKKGAVLWRNGDVSDVAILLCEGALFSHLFIDEEKVDNSNKNNHSHDKINHSNKRNDDNNNNYNFYNESNHSINDKNNNDKNTNNFDNKDRYESGGKNKKINKNSNKEIQNKNLDYESNQDNTNNEENEKREVEDITIGHLIGEKI